MKIGVICGSHRENSQSEKVGRYAAAQLESLGLVDEIFVFTLAGNPVPFWDEDLGSDDPKWESAIGELTRELDSCDGFIVVTPEWHGMVPSGLKNFFLVMTGAQVLAHKPALIIAVSASTGGAYPVAELRMSSYKNSRICYLPEHLIVRSVNEVFNADESENDAKSHDYLHGRLTYCLEMLREYARAFQAIRASGKASLEQYTNGM